MFHFPTKPRSFPAGPFPAGSQKEHKAKHQKKIKVYKTYLRVVQGLKALIWQAVDEDYILELQVEKIGYLQVTAKQMLAHLRTCWGLADFVNKCALLNK